MIILKTLTILLTAGLAVLGSAAVLPASEETAKPGPSMAIVVGEGQVLAVPDIARLQVAIVTEAPQAQPAAAENAKKAEAFVAAVKKFLPAGDSFKSTGYRIIPLQTYGERGKKPTITGYRVSSSFQIKLTDLTRLGDLIDLAIRQGVNEISGPFWEHAKMDQLLQTASVQALEKARDLAEALAKAQGMKVKRLAKVINRGRQMPVPRDEARMMMAPAGAERVAPPIEVGEQEIRAVVEAAFELE